MNGELTTAIDESSQSSQTVVLRRRRSIRLVGIGFGIFCYVSCAAIYFLSPSNPVLSLGRARFTVDALLELVFTLLALPAFGFAYFYGIRRHEENPDFAFPEFAIDLMFLAAMVWVAIGNGIHLTAKLDEQMISALNGEQGMGIRANFHWIRQEVGHVFPHIGWQMLFAALMLGQLKRPYRRRKAKSRGVVLRGCFWSIIRPRGHCGRLHSYRVCVDGYLLPRFFLFGSQIEVTCREKFRS